MQTKRTATKKRMVGKSLYLPSELAAAVERLAVAQDRKFNPYVVALLKQHIAAQPAATPEPAQ